MTALSLEDLAVGQTYAFDAVAYVFEMKAAVLTWQGGIISRPKQQALLVVTRPNLESIDYHDYWEGDDLVYGARGQRGDQRLEGVNRLLCDNSRRNFVFETLGNATMRYRGAARTVAHWWARAADVDKNERAVIRFLLRFGQSADDIGDDLVASLGETSGGTEGQRILRQHMLLERNRGLVTDAKRYWQRIDSRLSCEVCSMSFEEIYGLRGKQFIEAHHRVPLGRLNSKVQTLIVDLAPVCANCHRMLHRGDECTTETLRNELEEARVRRLGT